MARISLSRHWKFRRVARAVGTTYAARGLLEQVWEAAYEAANEYIGTPTDIADAAGWTGDPLELVALLLDAELLDERAPGEYVIHDLWDHVPKYVKLRWTRLHPGAPRPWHRENRGERPADRDRASSSVPKKGTCPGSTKKEQKKEQRRSASRSLPLDDKTPNVRVLVRLGYELDERYDTEADLADALKTIAAKYAVPYDGPSIGRALELLAHARAPLWITPQPQPRRRTG